MPTTIILGNGISSERRELRCGLSTCEDLSIVGEATTYRELIRLAIECRADVAIVTPRIDAIEAIRTLRACRAPTRFVIMAPRHRPDLSLKALKAGASGVLLSGAHVSEVCEAIETARTGGLYLARPVANSLAEEAARQRGYFLLPSILSEFELRLLRLMAEGHSGREIAEWLEIPPEQLESAQKQLHEDLERRGLGLLVPAPRSELRSKKPC